MGRCATCDNEFEATFRVTTPTGDQFEFDSIECAATKIAPRCQHCGCVILGHGIQGGRHTFCCANCARKAGIEDVADHSSRA
jgi:hypothetical protein